MTNGLKMLTAVTQYLHTQGRHSELQKPNGKRWKQENKNCLCFSSNSHYLAYQGLLAHYIQKEERSNYYFLEHFKNPSRPQNTQKTHFTGHADTRPFKRADQLISEIILLNQKILNVISVITELLFYSINRIYIYSFIGISLICVSDLLSCIKRLFSPHDGLFI